LLFNSVMRMRSINQSIYLQI